MTRTEYMDGKVTHEEFYSSVAKLAGISFADSPMLSRVKAALAKGDEHLNSIPLCQWDVLALNPICKANVSRALKEHNDYWTLAGGVCTLKQAAKNSAHTA